MFEYTGHIIRLDIFLHRAHFIHVCLSIGVHNHFISPFELTQAIEQSRLAIGINHMRGDGGVARPTRESGAVQPASQPDFLTKLNPIHLVRRERPR